MMNKMVWLLLLAFFASTANAAGVGIRLSNDAVGVTISDDLRAADGAFELGYMYREDKRHLGTAGLFATGQRGIVQGRLGGKLYYANLDRGVDGGGLALGGDLGLPMSDLITLQLGAYFSPSPISFGDIDRYRDYYLGFDFAILPNASLEAGYAKVEMRSDDPSRKIRMIDGLYFRMKLRF